MLVFTVKPDELIQIGPDIRLRITRDPATPGRFRVAIEAPRDVLVTRGEGK